MQNETPAPAAAVRRPGWLGPWRLPEGAGRRLLAAARGWGEWLGPWYGWLLAGALFGAAPLAAGYLLGWSGSRLISSLLLVPVLLAAAARDDVARGLTAVAAAFVAHSALAIALAACDPCGAAAALPGGADYWRRSRDWITTGVSPEYDLNWWLPAHGQLLAAMALFTYTSLGLLTFFQGLYEVDLMNYYVGQLMAHSASPGLALAVGWHPWSVCRGAGYLLVAYEVTSLSLARLTGVRLSTPARRGRRWGVGLALLLLDGVIKFCCLEEVRRLLAANLR